MSHITITITISIFGASNYYNYNQLPAN